jgi:tetratricopeptide (TPR) repeat protein
VPGISYWLVFLLAPTIIAAVTAQPMLLVVVVVAIFARRFIPDPLRWLQARGRQKRLEQAVALNEQNVTARRDLALVFLDQRRPRRAVALLERALERTPDLPELRFLMGLALTSSRKPEQALVQLDAALALDPRIRYGEAHLQRGIVLEMLGRTAEAVVAYETFVGINGSSIEGWTRLARARARSGDRDGGRKAIAEALSTSSTLPAFQRRKQWTWVLRARVASLRL